MTSPAITTAATATTIVPEVGMGATHYLWSDRHAYTVIALSPSKRTITLQRDKATLLNGMGSGEPDELKLGKPSSKQRYRFIRDKHGSTIKASLRRDGQWWTVGSKVRSGRSDVKLGRRSEHCEYSC